MFLLRMSPCQAIMIICIIANAAFSQEVRISGIVRDLNTHREIRSVNIYIKGTPIGTASDFAGRFSLRILKPTQNVIVVFKHIAYERRELSLDFIEKIDYVGLQPRVIPLQGVEIEESGILRLEIEKDLPQTVSVIEARSFEMRGYVDAGDLLRTDHSVQVEEELSGKKTVAIRGGNPDDVVVLYNGVKMNSSYDNTFDLSLIDLEDIERIEIIKGSNTALYGPEAFSGVINIVPKMRQDYNIRFQQRVGTYRSGNWGLHLYKDFDKIYGSYSIKRGGLSRSFVDGPENQGRLKNSSFHHTANLNYDFKNVTGDKSSLGAMWIYTSLKYDNQRENFNLSKLNHLFSLKYSGDLFKLRGIELVASFRKLDEEQALSFSRKIDDKALILNAQKGFKLSNFDMLFSYQYQHNELNLFDDRNVEIGFGSGNLQRQHHGFASIAKYHDEVGSDFLKTIDLDLSFRYDKLNDKQNDKVNDLSNDNDWQETMLKFALNLSGFRNNLFFNSFLNFGKNTKFPTLLQQASTLSVFSLMTTESSLNPEKNRSFELGATLSRDIRNESGIYGWQISGTYFQNHYENKFRVFITPDLPAPFYDNVKNARISGVEAKTGIFLFRKKVSVDLGISKYSLSEKAAFPFKSDFKRTMNFKIDHEGYSFQLHWFKEGEQTAWLRIIKSEPGEINSSADAFAEITLPSNTNIDLHISKSFGLGKLRFFVNASGRNLLNDNEVILQGLAIRDRRYYLTLAAQY